MPGCLSDGVLRHTVTDGPAKEEIQDLNDGMLATRIGNHTETSKPCCRQVASGHSVIEDSSKFIKVSDAV